MARRLLIAAVLLIVAAGFPAPSRAQQTPTEPLKVDLQPIGDATVSGFVLLSPQGDVTAVQILVIGAAEGTVALIHRGQCDDIDPAPFASIGDVGAAGQIQTTVPFPYPTLTSGDFLVALHLGLNDLTTAIACGEIPFATDGPPEPPDVPTATVDSPPDPPEETPTVDPTSTTEDPVEDDTYTSPTYGYSFSWDDSWSVSMAGTTGGGDFIMLIHDAATLMIQGTSTYGGDTAACLAAMESELRGLADAEDVVPFNDASGRSHSGSDAYSVWATFAYISTNDNIATGRRVQFHLCRRLSDDAVVAVHNSTFFDDYAEESAALGAVLATLVVPGQPVAPTVALSPTSAPEPTPTAATDTCAGMEEWMGATQSRLDRAPDISAYQLAGGNLLAYWSEAKVTYTSLASQQAAGPVPPAATDLNDRLTAVFDAEVDLLDRLITWIRTTPGDAETLGEYLQEADTNKTTMQGLTEELRLLGEACGIVIG